jgi:hypothetical protein
MGGHNGCIEQGLILATPMYKTSRKGFWSRIKDMLRTWQICHYLVEDKEEYRKKIEPTLEQIYKPYLRGVPMEELVYFIAKKENKNSPKEKDDIKRQIKSRIPKYLTDDTRGIGFTGEGRFGMAIHGSPVIDLAGDGMELTEKGIIKYLHFVRFWWEKWGAIVGFLVGASAVAIIWAIFSFFYSEAPKLLCRFILKC